MNAKATLVAAGIIHLSLVASAQAGRLFTTSVDLNVGNIVAPHLVHGDMWWNPATGISPVQFPKGVSGQLQGVASIWLAGRDAQQQLRGAMQDYRSKGTDFWPGPISGKAGDDSTNAVTAAWARIWRVNSSTIDGFLATANHTIANTPAEILEWPGNGNVYAKGANGSAITVSGDMAPFVDVNANGLYEPLLGDYPKMKGSQMLWWILNDDGLKTVSQTNSMQLEMRISAYAYANRTLADNIIFYEYDLRHNNQGGFFDFVFSPMVDFDIAYAFNDYVGLDPIRRLGVIYDANVGAPAGRAVAGGYVLLDQPGDSWVQRTPVGALNYMRNEVSSANSDAQNALEAHRYMTGYDRLGNRRNGNSNYAFTSLTAQCDGNETGADQRMLVATSARTFTPQQNLHFAYALVAADSAGVCPTISFARLEQTTDTAYKLYWNPSRVTPSTPVSVRNQAAAAFHIYPNPAQTVLNVQGIFPANATVAVTNAIGATVAVPVSPDGGGLRLDIAALPAGVYHLRLANGSIDGQASFIKR